MQKAQYIPAVDKPMKYIDIVIDNKSRMTDSFYTYLCSNEDAVIGSKVYVPFARNKNLREGYIFDIRQSDDRDLKFKEIDHIDEDICLNGEMIETCKWMKKRYLVKYIDGVSCFTPMGRPSKRTLKQQPQVLPSADFKELTAEQQNAVDTLALHIDRHEHKIFLVHGVTSSGKTEVYINAIERVIAQGRTAIMMVPEISLTRQVIERFEKHFGSSAIAIMHSRMTKPQRYLQWQRIRNGGVQIVIGARSAVFAPLENIGIIIMDEEHESTYKSDMTPKYETLEVAIKRAGYYSGIVVLGSATPSVVSYQRAAEGIYHKIEMKKRFNDNPLPTVEIADMTEETRNGNTGLLSRKLYNKINNTLQAGRQVILLLNRRGFATYTSCKNCGHVMKCPVCGISLTYHKDTNGLYCHFCGHKEPAFDICPECGESALVHTGAGTQKLEEEIDRLFPKYTYARLDLDAAQKAGVMNKILTSFAKHNTDILIGTQLIAKGLDFDNVGLVGIISADSSLNIPDFRASEKTFQLITQAAGRAGRGNLIGEVVIQTYSPDNYAVKAAAEYDYEGFCREELKLRKLMEYPPYCDLIRLIFSGEHEQRVKLQADKWYSELDKMIHTGHIYRPQPAPVNKIKETYRYHIMIKCPKGKRGLFLGALDKLNREIDSKTKVNVVIDINPYSFI